VNRRGGLQHRLTRAYLIQVLLISLATVGGVIGTAMIMENVLLKQALVKEADYFWQKRADNPDQPRPDTRHLLAYLDGPRIQDPVPDALQGLELGYHRVHFQGSEPLVYVDQKGDARLYLVFDEKRVTVLALIFGIVPLAVVLLLIYLSSFLTWRKSRQLVSPLVRLADLLRRTPMDDPRAARPDFSRVETDADKDNEVGVLVNALRSYSDRLLEFVERERQFTRDASHELRTPLAVIRANLELLSMRSESSPALRRIEDTVEDMDAVIESLLLLARGGNQRLTEEEIIVNDLVFNLADRLEPLARRKEVDIGLEQESLLHLRAPESVLTMVLTNLVRNAINYSGSGRVKVHVGNYEVLVSDAGRGMSAEELDRIMRPFERGDGSGEAGHGLGLAIVQRLCEYAGWTLEVASALDEGTRVRVRFPADQVIGHSHQPSEVAGSGV
jgi:signal transduction histidine kinase